MVIALAGRRVDARDAQTRRFPLENVGYVRKAVRELLERQAASTVVASAAAGSDLLAHAEAGALRLRRRVVLPFERAAFRETSVADRQGDWGPVYDKLLDEVSARDDLVVLQGGTDRDRAYGAANLAILDEAQAIARAKGQRVTAVLVWDGQSRGPDDLTAAFGEAARQRELHVLEVLTLRTCFVIQGFGEKPDLTTGRVLNLDASYEVIKSAVEAAGLRCVRADEIVHSGTIDVPMYQWLRRADLVIADLSTYNVNAAYELGVRYGLQPRTTIILAEKEFKNPFDVSHITIHPRYEHLGKDIGNREAKRLKEELAAHIRAVLDKEQVDSPVYTYLALEPPRERDAIPPPASPAAAAPPAASSPAVPGVAGPPGVPVPGPLPLPIAALEPSAKVLLEQALAAKGNGDFAGARALFEVLHTMRPNDDYVIQQLALATYKSKLPDPWAALEKAREILQQLKPESTNDPETLGLWGAVHKRFWEFKQDLPYLNQSIAGYERGFLLKQDFYNGINLAFLLNLRATVHRRAGDQPEAITDYVLARRVRREVVRLCEAALAQPRPDEDRYWIVATQWEAAIGLEDEPAAEALERQAQAFPVPAWMLETTRTQLATLRQLLAESPLKD